MKKITLLIAFIAIVCLDANSTIVALEDGSCSGGSVSAYPVQSYTLPTGISLGSFTTVPIGSFTTSDNAIIIQDLNREISAVEREMLNLQFQQFDQRAQELLNILSNVLKTLRELVDSIIRNLT
jgi:hypothetical protein